MAPEQFQGRAGPGSDLYGLAATILTTLTGVEPERQPHRGLTIDVRAALGGAVDARFCRVLQGMLQPNPDERPSSLRHWLAQISHLSVALARASGGPSQLVPASDGRRENLFFIYTCVGMGSVFVTILSMPWLGPGGGWLLPISVVVTMVVLSRRQSR
jgi:serine/threonine protein kinase